MAIGIPYNAAPSVGSMQSVIPASARGVWQIVNDDAETAQSASMLLAPATITDATFHWCEVRDGATRVIIRARYAVGATVTTDPVVRLIGAYGTINTSSGAMANDGTVKFMRLDNVDANAAGLTLDLVSSGTGQMQDATYAYCDPMPDLTGIDMKGCNFVGVAVETAADVNGALPVPIELLFLN